MPAGLESVFTWAAPPLKFGAGALDEIGSDVRQLGVTRCLVLTDAGVGATGVPARAMERIRAAGVECELYDSVVVEPTDLSVTAAADWACGGGWDGFVAIGGGSVIDTAKGVNLLITQPGELLDYVAPPLGGGRAPSRPLHPLVAVPTTAGTGSESTTICVVDLLSKHLKAGVSHVSLRPSLAVVDPELTFSMPREVTASSGMDVLSHALESYTAKPFDARPRVQDPTRRPAFCGANPVSDHWSERALQLVGRYLRRAVEDGYDAQARYQMALASTYAGTGFGNAGTHLPHANAYPIAGAVRDYRAAGYPAMPMVPHGQAVAATAPEVFRWTYEADPQRHLHAAALLTCTAMTATDGAGALAEAVAALSRDIGMPRGLRAFGYDEDDLDGLVDGTLQQTRQLAVVPREVDRESLKGIYQRSL